MKKSMYSLLMGILLFTLIACTYQKDLTAEWHDRAEEPGFVLECEDGYALSFSSEGMKGIGAYEKTSLDDEERPPAFPFELGTAYADYKIFRKDETITISTTDGLEYTLTIIKDRLFKDEETGQEYTTYVYLLGEEETQK